MGELAEAARLMRDVLEGSRPGELREDDRRQGPARGRAHHAQGGLDDRAHFCKAIADAIVAYAPDRFTANMSKAKRIGKIFVDYVRNTRGSTSIAPYSTRAREHATVSVPLRWEELSGEVRPDSFTVLNLGERLRALTGDPWEGFHEAGRAQTITDDMKRAVGLG